MNRPRQRAPALLYLLNPFSRVRSHMQSGVGAEG